MAEALKTVISKSTECPVCLSTFTDPKILSCSHTFCKACLDNLLEHVAWHGNSQIRCPVCRSVTQVPNKDVGRLQVNLALKSLIEDMKGHPQICTNCKSNDKPHADVYCQDCDKYLGTFCLIKHSQCEGFIGHEVIAMSEISSGKVSVRRYRKRRKHPTCPKEHEDYFCSTCKKGKGVCKRNIGKDELGLGKVIYVIIIIIVSFCIAQIALQHNIVVGLGRIVNVGLVEKYVVLPTYNIAHIKNVPLPAKDSMNIMVSTPDGRMAVGCNPGGISIFSPDGKLQQTVLKDIGIRGIGFLSDGRCVVIDMSNNLRLYTPEYTKLNVMFKTLSRDEGGIPNLTVDGDDLIYVSYRKAKKILVFSTAGGQAIREIPCNGYIPEQITNYHGSLITKTFDTIRLIDKQGAVQHELKKPGSLPHAAVSQWNTILIAEVKHGEGLVSIDEYTYELKHIRNLVNDYKIEKPDRNWYDLQQYRSGEIAFCTPDRLYIFR